MFGTLHLCGSDEQVFLLAIGGESTGSVKDDSGRGLICQFYGSAKRVGEGGIVTSRLVHEIYQGQRAGIHKDIAQNMRWYIVTGGVMEILTSPLEVVEAEGLGAVEVVTRTPRRK